MWVQWFPERQHRKKMKLPEEVRAEKTRNFKATRTLEHFYSQLGWEQTGRK